MPDVAQRLPLWVRRFASWLDTRLNYGPRLHLLHVPSRDDCDICGQWQLHDLSFDRRATYQPTRLARELQEANRP